MNFSLFDLLVIIGISQGLFTGYLLLMSKQGHLRNKLLAFIQFTFILISCKILLHTLGLWDTHIFRYLPLSIDLTIQPLIYLFTRASVDRNYHFKPKAFFHFVPCLVFLVHAVIVYALVQSTTVIAEKDNIANALHFNEVKSVEDFVSVVSAWIYGGLCYVSLRNYRTWLNDNTADMTYPSYTWLRNVLRLFAVLMLILSVNVVLDNLGFGSNNFLHWQLFYIIIAVVIYYMGIQGYYRQQFTPPIVEKENISSTSISYDQESIARVQDKILAALNNEKVYRDPEISLIKMSEKLNLPPAIVSHVVNNIMKKNFRNLINDYRIEEVKLRMADPNFRHLSILGIALDCGFNSEASFYRVFKKTTGMSPKEFREHSK